MKKIIPIIICLIFVASCSNPEDTKKIEELEKKVQENSLKEKEFIYEKNKECKNYENEIKNNINYDSLLMGEINIYYSSKLNTCIYSLIYYNKNQFIDYIAIKNILTNEEVKRFFCSLDSCTGLELIEESKQYINNIK